MTSPCLRLARYLVVLLASSDWALFQDDSYSGAYFMIVRSSEKKYSHFFGSTNLSSSSLMTLRYDGELAKALKPSILSNHNSIIPSVSPKFGPAGRPPAIRPCM